MRVVTRLTGLSGGQGWHVHTHPVDQTLAQAPRCSNDNIGGHFDPMMQADNPQYSMLCNSTNQARCEIGDLAGKLGNIPMSGALDGTDTTKMLTLFGRYGIIGRSIKIHKVDDQNRDACATIRINTEFENTPVITLAATFVSPYAGVIYLRQVGDEDVAVFGKIYKVNDTTTLGHNWHIHQNLVSMKL